MKQFNQANHKLKLGVILIWNDGTCGKCCWLMFKTLGVNFNFPRSSIKTVGESMPNRIDIQKSK